MEILFDSELGFDTDMNPGEYYIGDAIRTYHQRELTHSNDILKAFQGFLTSMQSHGTCNFLGVMEFPLSLRRFAS